MPGYCEECLRLRERLMGDQDEKSGARSVSVRTWCRICNAPVELEIPPRFDEALDVCRGLDDMEFTCRNHDSAGGWGWHWRFDDVLAAVFRDGVPMEESDIPYFPLPPWYEYYDEKEKPVEILEDPREGKVRSVRREDWAQDEGR